MDKYAKKIILLFTVSVVMVASFAGCSNSADNPQTENGKIHYENETHIILSDNGVTANGKPVGEKGKVYLSNDVIYYEDKDSYESGNPYGEGTDADKHTADEAAATTVVNITEAGFYRLSGKLGQGQIRVDLGKDADEDENAVVTLVLDGLDINCDVAPAVVFMNVYECDNSWDAETATSIVDTSDAGANVIIADGSINNIEGAYVAKIYKDKDGEKKLWKQDGAVYSYMSMNIDGEKDGTGILNITADNEGLGTELHLTISGGNINIYSENDGINTNEDGVSVTTINDGNVHVVAGLGEEGDGIDSNGWLVINGGTVVSAAKPASDSGLDSDMGSYINGGTVVALGSTMNWAESDSAQVTMNLQFAEYKESGSAIIVTKEDGSVVFAYNPSEDEALGGNAREFMGAVISCPEFALEETYNVYVGSPSETEDTIAGVEINGIYDVSSITSVNAVQQGYTGSDIMMHPGGFGGKHPEMPKDEIPAMKEGEMFDPEKMKPKFENGQIPAEEDGNPVGFGGEGRFDFDPSKLPEDIQFPSEESGQPPQIPDKGTPPWNANGENVADKKLLNTLFYMQDKVNNFSGVADYIS